MVHVKPVNSKRRCFFNKSDSCFHRNLLQKFHKSHYTPASEHYHKCYQASTSLHKDEPFQSELHTKWHRQHRDMLMCEVQKKKDVTGKLRISLLSILQDMTQTWNAGHNDMKWLYIRMSISIFHNHPKPILHHRNNAYSIHVIQNKKKDGNYTLWGGSLEQILLSLI